MNYTEKYHLPQWEETDRIMRTDFNQMCADMEAGLNKTNQDAAAATAAVKQESTAAAAKAQITANTAVSKADAAQATADAAYCPDFKPYVAGTYVGDGYASQEIVLGFRPSFVAVTDVVYGTGKLIGAGEGVGRYLGCTSSGFRAATPTLTSTQTGKDFPYLNDKNVQYAFIAFR